MAASRNLQRDPRLHDGAVLQRGWLPALLAICPPFGAEFHALPLSRG